MPSDRIAYAVVLRLISVALFGTMNAVMKLAAARSADLIEIMFFRQFGAVLLIAGVVAAGPGLASVRTERMGAHLLRAGIGLAAMWCFFTAILALPLAESTAIGFTIPIFTTVLAAAILKERVGPWRWGAVMAGFAGVLVVTRPGSGGIPVWAALVALAGCFLTANVSILLRQMSRTEATATTVFWFSLLSLPPLAFFYLPAAQAHPPIVWAHLLAIGFLGGAAQFAMTGSLRHGPVSVVVPMDYSSLLYAALLGWLLFDALPAPATWIGAPIIVASGLVIVWREHVRRKEETRQATGDPG